MSLYGVLGIFLLVIGFSYETFKTVNRKKCNINKAAILAFIIASVLLLYHAYLVNDKIFMILNSIIATVNIINLYYALSY